MIRLDIDDKKTGIRGEALSQAMIDHAPGWIVGDDPAPNGKLAAALSLVKGVIPTIINWLYMDAKKRGGDMPPPDFKSPEARQNTMVYVIRYLLDNFAATASREHFQAVGQVQDGIFIIESIISTPAQVGGASPVAAISTPGDPPGSDTTERDHRESDGSLAPVGRNGDG